MGNKKIILILILMIVGTAILVVSLRFYGKSQPARVEPVTIALYPYDASALVFIALDRGFFARNGLNVTLRENYNSSIGAINALLGDEADFAISSEYNIVDNAFKRENISIIGCIDKYEAAYVVARKDKGITNIHDLKGKKIGVTRGTIAEFNLGRLLDLNGMRIKDVTLVDLRPAQRVEAIVNGSVDALVTGSFFDQLRERLGENFLLLSAQSSQLSYWVLSSRSSWAVDHPEQINRLLKSLVQAEKYALHNPAESKAIVQKRLRYDEAYIARIWPHHRFSLSLDLSLIVAMKDEAQWMMKNNLTTEKSIPDFVNHIYVEGLKAVKPEAVNIIR
jgi:NitT/TauT family transport system substrate-binding protein